MVPWYARFMLRGRSGARSLELVDAKILVGVRRIERHDSAG
jgi:hypothetical protein